jgi:hypothetical protein
VWGEADWCDAVLVRAQRRAIATRRSLTHTSGGGGASDGVSGGYEPIDQFFAHMSSTRVRDAVHTLTLCPLYLFTFSHSLDAPFCWWCKAWAGLWGGVMSWTMTVAGTALLSSWVDRPLTLKGIPWHSAQLTAGT